MNTTNFSLEFGLNAVEIQKLNKMYFKNLYIERVRIFFVLLLVVSIFYDFFDLDKSNDVDFINWIIRDLAFVIIFLLLQYSFVNSVCKLIFQLIKKLVKSRVFVDQYKFNFTGSSIYVHSPLGEFVHKWTQIEKAILTKDFFLLYVKERNGYIISISNKNKERNLDKLITFIENNVTCITKV